MKAFGLILVAIGGLVLGLTELADQPDTSRQLFAGMAIVVGLIILASGGRRAVN